MTEKVTKYPAVIDGERGAYGVVIQIYAAPMLWAPP